MRIGASTAILCALGCSASTGNDTGPLGTGGFDQGGAPNGGLQSTTGGAPGGGGQTSTAPPASGGTVSGSGGSTVAGTGGFSPGGTIGSGGASSGGVAGNGGQTAAGGAAAGGTNATGGGGMGAAGAGGAGAGGAGAGGAGGGGKFVGNITTRGAVRDGFAKYWNQITPENEGKWGSVQPSQGTFNWSALDKIYAYAGSNNVIFKQHNFLWGPQQPSWVNNGNAQTAVQAWIKAFCDRYPNTKLIDVVNEPVHNQPVYINGIGGAGTSGFDWIVNAFKWARASCPNAILILNDYNTIEYDSDNSKFINIVNKIKAAGAPIDAIGAQGHDAYKFSSSQVKGYIDKLAATGLPVYITEFDIPTSDDNKQKSIMQDLFPMFWTDPDVHGITLWGYIVGATWKSGMNETGLQQTDGTMRPAMTWLMNYLNRPTM